MPKYGNRWVEKLIPARGEAEVMARVKGSYGGKMQSRGYRRRGYRKNSTKNPEAQYAKGGYGNVNWADGRPNLLWNQTVSDGHIERFLSFNANAVDSNAQQPQVFLRRINLEMAVLADIAQVYIAGDRNEFTANERAQIPGVGITETGDALTGQLLGGDRANGTLLGGISWAEGVPVTFFMIYETLDEANLPLADVFDGNSIMNEDSQRNKRIFWQKLVVPTLYRPVTFNIKKNFPGAGVRLSMGEREIYQVTLAYQVPAGTGANVRASASAYVGENRFWYFLDKP